MKEENNPEQPLAYQTVESAYLPPPQAAPDPNTPYVAIPAENQPILAHPDAPAYVPPSGYAYSN